MLHRLERSSLSRSIGGGDGKRALGHMNVCQICSFQVRSSYNLVDIFSSPNWSVRYNKCSLVVNLIKMDESLWHRVIIFCFCWNKKGNSAKTFSVLLMITAFFASSKYHLFWFFLCFFLATWDLSPFSMNYLPWSASNKAIALPLIIILLVFMTSSLS